MASPWIKMRTDLGSSPQVVRIASALEADDRPHAVRRLTVVGALHATWSIFDAHSEDGTLQGYTPTALDEQIGLPGWTAALEDVGWLILEHGGMTLPRWEEHNGRSAKRRARDANRKAAVRGVSA